MNNRQMPPPSPPQHYPTPRGQSANVPPLSTPFLSREPPGNPAHRPGSSMSISSMLGSDADRPARDIGSSSLFPRAPVSSSSSSYGSAPPPSATSGAMSPPTAPARPSSLDYPLFRRSHTPEKSFAKNHPPARPYRSSSGGIPQVSIGEQAKFSPLSRPPAPSSQYPDKPSASHPSPPISSAETVYNESRRLSQNGPIPRPTSQPQQAEPPARPSGYSPLSQPGPAFGEGAQQRPSSFLEHGRLGSLYDRQPDDLAYRERERALREEFDSRVSSSHRYGAYGDRENAGRQQPPPWELGRSQPPSPEAKRFPATESTPGFGFGAIQNYTKSLGSQVGGSRPPSLSTQPRQNQPTPPPSEQPPYVPKLQTEPSRLFGSGVSSTGPSPLTHSAPDDRRKGSEELLHHRNLLGVGAEKRGGRASPLPQAVQGASGPGGESSIKNDLGRVFSGIGSGVGGVTAPTIGSGHSTPMAMSPFKRDNTTARSTNGDTTDETKIARPGSTTGRRSRKSRDEDMEGEMVEPRTGASGRGGRRGRHPHHHHHQYASFFFFSIPFHMTTERQLTLMQSPSPSFESGGRSGRGFGRCPSTFVVDEFLPPRFDSIGRGWECRAASPPSPPPSSSSPSSSLPSCVCGQFSDACA